MLKSYPRCTESESTFSQDAKWFVSYCNVRSLGLQYNTQLLRLAGKTPYGLAPTPLSSSAPYFTLLLPLGAAFIFCLRELYTFCKHIVLFHLFILLHLLFPLLEIAGAFLLYEASLDPSWVSHWLFPVKLFCVLYIMLHCDLFSLVCFPRLWPWGPIFIFIFVS